MFDTIVGFLSQEAVKVLAKKYPNLPPEAQAKIHDAVFSASNLVADVAAIVVAICNASVISNPPKA